MTKTDGAVAGAEAIAEAGRSTEAAAAAKVVIGMGKAQPEAMATALDRTTALQIRRETPKLCGYDRLCKACSHQAVATQTNQTNPQYAI
jgi:hypothetical protein